VVVGGGGGGARRADRVRAMCFLNHDLRSMYRDCYDSDQSPWLLS
jgi:hypothetical protein